MKVPSFIIGSSVMLSLWLGATYLRPVPMETYAAPGASVTATPELPGPISSAEVLSDAN